MIINEKIKNILPIKDFNQLYVVSDFDRTISAGTSPTSWSVLEENSLVPESYIEEAQKLYEQYRPIEIDESLDFIYRSAKVKEWAYKHIELFCKYQFDESLFDDTEEIYFRNGTKEFLRLLNDKNIPLIIISAGVGNLIESFLKNNNCYYPNIYICSNKITFKEGKCFGVDDRIIHSLNKNNAPLADETKQTIEGKKQVILFGDQIGDIKMVDDSKYDNVIKIGFLTDETLDQKERYTTLFDIVCDINEGFDEVMELLFREK